MKASKPALTFPCEFPIKVMGPADADLEQEVIAIIERHTSKEELLGMSTRPSRAGKYCSITIRLHATSRQQLDDIYRDLSASELVLMAL